MERNLATRAVAWAWDRTPMSIRAALLAVYPPPAFRVGALALVVNARDELLLLEHRFRAGCPWGLPGGWVEPKEAPREALARELKEELGIDVAPDALELLAVEGRAGRSHLEVFYRLRADIERVPPNVEFVDSRYFAPAALPRDMLDVHRALVLRILGPR